MYIHTKQPLQSDTSREPTLEFLAPCVSPQLWLLVGKYHIKTGLQVHLSRWNSPRLLLAHAVNSVAEVDAQEDGNADVSCKEAACRPQRWEEYVEAIDKSQEGEEDDGCPSSIRLHP